MIKTFWCCKNYFHRQSFDIHNHCSHHCKDQDTVMRLTLQDRKFQHRHSSNKNAVLGTRLRLNTCLSHILILHIFWNENGMNSHLKLMCKEGRTNFQTSDFQTVSQEVTVSGRIAVIRPKACWASVEKHLCIVTKRVAEVKLPVHHAVWSWSFLWKSHLYYYLYQKTVPLFVSGTCEGYLKRLKRHNSINICFKTKTNRSKKRC